MSFAIPAGAVAEEAEPFRAGLREDLKRYFVYHPDATFARKLLICLETEGIWALATYRFGRALRTRRTGGAFWALYRLLELAVRFATGIHLDVDSLIAPGFYVGHCFGIVVGAGVRIGAHSSISQMCTVAASELSPGEPPSIGERVYLGPGSRVIGAVRIGDGAVVGANAVVLEDVPRGAVAVGNPARLAGTNRSADLIYLGDGPPPASVAAEGRTGASPQIPD